MFQLASSAVIIALTAVDQLIKYLVDMKLSSGDTVTLIPGVLQLECVYNYGGMWGLFAGKANVLAIFTSVILLAALALLMARKIKPLFVSWCVVAIIAGGIGNLLDRIFRGYVIDYIGTVFVNFPTYNFADCLVTVGCFLLMGYEIYEIIRDAKSKKENEL